MHISYQNVKLGLHPLKKFSPIQFHIIQKKQKKKLKNTIKIILSWLFLK